ncbi:MAG: MFS transporter, partial [bacterium]|nr:MFS transporter [bacterium]
MTGFYTTIARVFLPFAAGYFLSYTYRVVNAVIAPDLVAELSLGPSSLGMLTSIYFIAFAAFQLPLGVLLDRYGPRKIEALLLIIAGLGAYIFSIADSIAGLVAARAMIGFGVSSCLMAAFKAYTLWFPREKWPLINGFQMAAGGLGALAATIPVQMALSITDWRGVFLALALLTFLASAAVYFIVPEKPREKQGESIRSQIGGIRQVFTSRNFWSIAPLTTASQAAFFSIQGLWAGPWRTNVAQLNRDEAAGVLFWVAIAMICGFIVIGYLSVFLVKKGISVTTSAISGMTLFMAVQLALICLPPTIILPLWLLFGFTGTCGIIAYSALSQAFPPSLSGRVTTAVN